MSTKFQKRLIKLADFLDELREDKFDFDTMCQIVKKPDDHTCGTATCALGWCPNVFPNLVKNQLLYNNPSIKRTIPLFPNSTKDGTQVAQHSAAAEFFGIGIDECLSTFFNTEVYHCEDMKEIKPGDVAKRLRSLAKKNDK